MSTWCGPGVFAQHRQARTVGRGVCGADGGWWELTLMSMDEHSRSRFPTPVRVRLVGDIFSIHPEPGKVVRRQVRVPLPRRKV
jgi:hypothetical protein